MNPNSTIEVLPIRKILILRKIPMYNPYKTSYVKESFLNISIIHYICTMEKEQLIGKINSFLAEEFEVDPNIITPNAIIKDTLGLDSLDFVDLVVLIERNFGFKMAGEDFINLKSFEDFYQYVFERLQQSVDI